jgi:perosamine synthetase
MDKIDLLASEVVDLSKNIFGNDFTPLHRPVFEGNERQYLIDCIDSNFVSSVGAKVQDF